MFYSLSISETFENLKTNEDGLCEHEAQRRLAIYGLNEVGKGKRRTLIELLGEQFKNYLLILIIIAGVISYFIGHTIDAIAMGFVVILNVFFGMLLEYRADKSMDELKKLTDTNVVVRREGKKKIIESCFLVPGDVIFVDEGVKVPADARIITEYGLEINEASLTGESLPVKKSTEKTAQQAPLAERKCMLYTGSFVARGNAIAVVTATGQKTEFGGIEKTLSEVSKERTVLEKTIIEVGKTITFASVTIVAILFAVGIIFSKWTVGDLLIYSISLMVAAVPEGMITFLTIILAIGVKNMANEKALARKLKAVETLGNITFIASDKTGTITKGKMTLVKIYQSKIKDIAELRGTEKILHYSYLCNSAHLTEHGVVGDETDCALLTAGISKGRDIIKIRQDAEKISFKSFDSVKKAMSGIFRINGKEIAIIKGAPETILTMCSVCEGGSEDENNDKNENRREINEITQAQKDEIHANLTNLTEAGMRVIAIAYGKPVNGVVPEKGLVFLGFLAFYDPIRDGVKEAIAAYKSAGIRVIMMTGDNLVTAKKIAHEIGLDQLDGKGNSDKIGNKIANWSELAHMNDTELDKALKTISVIARATPASKLRIVERLVKQGEIIAVTGDGINDAPALKKAHVGVVMGSGTDVSKEVADVVLMDDNFATLEKAIEFGRGIKRNIINFLKFQITTNFALILLSIPFVVGIKIFEPIHILWINLVIDGPPALTLGLEKPSKDIMKEKPRKNLSLIDMEFIAGVTHMTIYIAVLSILIYFYYSKVNPEIAITAMFTAFVFMQIFNALNCRSAHERFYTSLFSNKWLVIALVCAALFQLTIVYNGLLREFFKIVPLPVSDLVAMFLVSASVLLVGEARKFPFFLKKEKTNDIYS
ncbi:MAG: cation-transporting P-type ATPase [Candidatus Micrarchaeota archaeon]